MTALKVPRWDAVHTDVPFRLDGAAAGGTRTVVVGDTTYAAATGVGVLPHDLADLADGDLLEITVGDWAGTVEKVIEATKQHQKTCRRVPIEEVARPVEWEAAP